VKSKPASLRTGINAPLLRKLAERRKLEKNWKSNSPKPTPYLPSLLMMNREGILSRTTDIDPV
jgi:hypothetical protein